GSSRRRRSRTRAATAAAGARSSARGTAPRRRLTATSTAPSRARTNSVLPPPMSKTTTAPGRGASPQSTPWSVSRASSPPDRTRRGWPVAEASAAAKAAPLAASRTALVPTISTRPAPRRAARSAYSMTVSAVRVIAASEGGAVRRGEPVAVCDAVARHAHVTTPDDHPPPAAEAGRPLRVLDDRLCRPGHRGLGEAARRGEPLAQSRDTLRLLERPPARARA